MPWVYKQSTGELCDPTGVVVATGYAGNGPVGINNPDAQDKHDIGPLPRGFYTLKSCTDDKHLGPVTLGLKPDSDNVMFGRSGFLIHSMRISEIVHPNTRESSHGCIIMPRKTREALWASADHRLEVIR